MNEFVQLYPALYTHRKTKRLAKRLGVSVFLAASHLAKLWTSVLEHAADGHLVDWQDEDIADYACWEGDAADFVCALVENRWLDRDDRRTYCVVHDWLERTGTIKKAATTTASRIRKEQERDRKEGQATRPSHDVTVTAGGVTVGHALTTTEQNNNRTEQTTRLVVVSSGNDAVTPGGFVEFVDSQFKWKTPTKEQVETFEVYSPVTMTELERARDNAVAEAAQSGTNPNAGFLLHFVKKNRKKPQARSAPAPTRAEIQQLKAAVNGAAPPGWTATERDARELWQAGLRDGVAIATLIAAYERDAADRPQIWTEFIARALEQNQTGGAGLRAAGEDQWTS